MPVTRDEMYFLTKGRAVPLPHPPWMSNRGFVTGSLNSVVRWLGERAEAAGLNLFPGFPAAELLIEDGRVCGVVTIDKGISAKGERRSNFESGTELRAKVTVLCDGSRGHLTKRLVKRFGIAGRNPQVYETGVKETWEVPGAESQVGRVIHTAGWPLPRTLFGGSFLYWIGGDLITLGLVVDLDYEDPALDIHEEFQRWKTHPFVRAILRTDVTDLTVVSYGGPDLGLLCSAGKVKRVYYGFVSLDSPPFYDPWFAKARTTGAIEARLAAGSRAAPAAPRPGRS